MFRKYLFADFISETVISKTINSNFCNCIIFYTQDFKKTYSVWHIKWNNKKNISINVLFRILGNNDKLSDQLCQYYDLNFLMSRVHWKHILWCRKKSIFIHWVLIHYTKVEIWLQFINSRWNWEYFHFCFIGPLLYGCWFIEQWISKTKVEITFIPLSPPLSKNCSRISIFVQSELNQNCRLG